MTLFEDYQEHCNVFLKAQEDVKRPVCWVTLLIENIVAQGPVFLQLPGFVLFVLSMKLSENFYFTWFTFQL